MISEDLAVQRGIARVQRTSSMSALLSLALTKRERPHWVRLSLQAAAHQEGIRPEALSRVLGRAHVPYQQLITDLTRRGRPVAVALSLREELAILNDLLEVQRQIIGRDADLQSQVVEAWQRLTRCHPSLTKRRFCHSIKVPERTLRAWLSIGSGAVRQHTVVADSKSHAGHPICVSAGNTPPETSDRGDVDGDGVSDPVNPSSHLALRLECLGMAVPEDGFDTARVLPNWSRTLEVPARTSLEELSAIITSALQWGDDQHLFLYNVEGQIHAYLTFLEGDDFIVPDYRERHLSCTTSLLQLALHPGQIFYYVFDFGPDHTFRMTVERCFDSSSKEPVWLVATTGGRLLQYPRSEARPTRPAASPELPLTIDYKRPHRLPHRVRFVQHRDKVTLENWRQGNDRRLWARAVVILENRSFELVELAKKVEQPDEDPAHDGRPRSPRCACAHTGRRVITPDRDSLPGRSAHGHKHHAGPGNQVLDAVSLHGRITEARFEAWIRRAGWVAPIL